MKVAITGAGGQVGRSLIRTAPPEVSLLAWDHKDLDVSNANEVSSRVANDKPDIIINAAAFTAVDLAETNEEAAYRVNSDAVEYLAQNASRIGARLVHLSTDFVFDGIKSQPYCPADEAHPLSIYGKSKRDGELKALSIMERNAIVIRTAWVYAAEGKNFVTTILDAAARDRTLRVVSDQFGSPTWAVSLSEAVWRAALLLDLSGILHWTDAGQASRYEFAVAIVTEAAQRGLIPNDVELIPVRTGDHPTVAKRPAYSVLDLRETSLALNLEPRHWRSCLRIMLDEIANA